MSRVNVCVCVYLLQSEACRPEVRTEELMSSSSTCVCECPCESRSEAFPWQRLNTVVPEHTHTQKCFMNWQMQHMLWTHTHFTLLWDVKKCSFMIRWMEGRTPSLLLDMEVFACIYLSCVCVCVRVFSLCFCWYVPRLPHESVKQICLSTREQIHIWCKRQRLISHIWR